MRSMFDIYSVSSCVIAALPNNCFLLSREVSLLPSVGAQTRKETYRGPSTVPGEISIDNNSIGLEMHCLQGCTPANLAADLLPPSPAWSSILILSSPFKLTKPPKHIPRPILPVLLLPPIL